MTTRAWVAATAVLAVTAGVALASGARRPAARDAASRAYGAITGGAGLGTATSLDRCARAFDPRLAPTCATTSGPTPGAGFTCPHAASPLPIHDSEAGR